MRESLIKKRIRYRLAGTEISLDVSQSLFSSFQVDLGTQLLLSTLRHNTDLRFEKLLDLGCGAGVIGLYLKQKFVQADVHMTDRDALAVAFAEHNAGLNKLQAACYPSLDYHACPRDFSLILFNFPAKLEREGLQAFVYRASEHLAPGGACAFVVVNELRDDAEQVIGPPQIRRDYEKHGKGHSVFHVSFTGAVEAPGYDYARSSLTLPLPGNPKIITARGLPEFDRLNFATEALIALLRELPRCESIAVLEAGQGHAAAAAALLLRPEHVTLYSRDLLALDFSKRNLAAVFHGNIEARAVPFLAEPPRADLIIWHIEDKNDLPLHLVNAAKLAEAAASKIVFGEKKLVEAASEEIALSPLRRIDQGAYCACHLP